MCRERNREPAWVAAIRLALFEGEVDVEGVIEEANLDGGYERTVTSVLRTMADRNLLRCAGDFEETGRYRPTEKLMRSAPSPKAAENVSPDPIYRRQSPAE